MRKVAPVVAGAVLLASAFLLFGGGGKIYSEWTEGTFTVEPAPVERAAPAPPPSPVPLLLLLMVLVLTVLVALWRWNSG